MIIKSHFLALRKGVLSIFSFTFLFIVATCLVSCGSDQPDRPLNVLWIMVDDLRPQLGCYGDQTVKSPHIDALAERSLLFNQAYCQSAVCSPSRNSMLSGLRPHTTGLHGFGKNIRDAIPDVITLPQHFKQNGYEARGFGKIFHIYAESMLGSEDDPASWSQPLRLPTVPVWGPEQTALREKLIEEARSSGKVFKHPHDWPRAETWDDSDVPDDEMQDGNTTAMAIEFLRTRESDAPPFFLAVGFLRPHLPFNAPKKYWDLYQAPDISLPEFRELPKNAPSWSVWQGIVKNYYNMPEFENIDEAFLQRYIQAYLACISYVDACVGRLMKALEETGNADNTMIVLLGDHGYQMGEYNSWGHKQTNFEISTRAPLIVYVPGMKTSGKKTNEIVEFLDLFPTLCKSAGLPIPSHAEGTSFAALFDDPEQSHKGFACSEKRLNGYMGKSLRTTDFRYTEWRDQDGLIVEQELYDHRNDQSQWMLEKENVINREGLAKVVEKLESQLAEVLK
ncbi:MAG: sulfatase [Bacteroidota bacterium]